VNNRLRLGARLTQKEPVRYTPAGQAVLAFRVEHRSTQTEAGHPRDVSLEVECVAIGDIAQRVDAVTAGTELVITGFLAAKSKLSRILVMHVNEIDLK
jgi:primosomal replication protein N